MNKSICVYLGANQGNNEQFIESVVLLGKEIAAKGLTLIYGGSSLGLMGLLATTTKQHGGQVIGVTTRFLIEQEKPLSMLDELHIVASMQERKQMLQELADLFLVVPGGLGTLEEAFETWNAIKIGIMNKPIGFLNTAGFFDSLFAFINTCEQSGFLTKQQFNIPVVASDVREILGAICGDKPAALVSS
ncbi:MAG: TIGR00730 family Rossman fold protein [Legionella sp.]|nr:TIGR00730 family Rossman fold protein [Legionella sp.]